MIWLPFMVLGLLLDILGVWLLASPLLKIDLRNKENLEKKTKELVAEYQKVKNH